MFGIYQQRVVLLNVMFYLVGKVINTRHHRHFSALRLIFLFQPVLFVKQTNIFLDQDALAAHAESTTCDFTKTQNMTPKSSLENLFTSCHRAQCETTHCDPNTAK